MSRFAGQQTFLALLALILVNQLGFGLIQPVLPQYARTFGLGPASIGALVTIYGVARFFANVPAGMLAQRSGRRPVLIIGTAITSIASALFATATTPTELFAYRLLAGLGAATVLTGGQVMVGDLANPENRGRMMSTYQGVFLAGVTMGPLPAGILADHFGIRAPFIAYAIFSGLACVCAMILIRETRGIAPAQSTSAQASQHAAPEGGTLSTLMTPAFILIGFVTFSQFFARTGAIFVLLPLLGADRFHLSASGIGLAQTLINGGNFATVYFSGALADKYGRKIVIAPATIVTGISLAMWAWAPSEWWYLAAAVVWGFGAGLSGPAPAAYISDLSPSTIRAQIFGIWRSVSDGGYIIGPVLLGYLAGKVGYNAPLLGTAAIVTISGLLFWLFAPEFHIPVSRRLVETGAEAQPAKT